MKNLSKIGESLITATAFLFTIEIKVLATKIKPEEKKSSKIRKEEIKLLLENDMNTSKILCILHKKTKNKQKKSLLEPMNKFSMVT